MMGTFLSFVGSVVLCCNLFVMAKEFIIFYIEGSVYFMPPGQVFSWHFEGSVDGFSIHFSEEFFRSFLQDPTYFERFPFFNDFAGGEVCQLTGENRQKAEGLLDELRELSNNTLNTSPDLAKVLLVQLFIVMEMSILHTSS